MEPPPPPPPVEPGLRGRLGVLANDPEGVDRALAAGLHVRLAGIHRPQTVDGTWGNADALLAPAKEFPDLVTVGLDNGRWPGLPRLEKWLDWLGQVVQRYPWVRRFCLFNEPPNQKTKEGAWQVDPTEFAVLLAATADTLHRLVPGCEVAAPELRGQDLLRPEGWSRVLLTHPARWLDQVDVLTVHFIPSRSVASEVLDNARQVWRYLRSPVSEGGLYYMGRIRVTEVGYSSDPKFQEPRYADEDGQALWLSDVLPLLLAIGYEQGFWARLIDGAQDSQPGQAFYANGLLRADLSPKPAWGALVTLLEGKHA